MAVVFADSFDHYATADIVGAKYTSISTPFSVGGSATIAAVGARSTKGLRLLSGGATTTNSPAPCVVLDAPVPSGPTCIAGFRYRCVTPFSRANSSTDPEAFAGNCVCALKSGGSVLWWVRQNSTGTLSVLRGSAAVLGTTPSALVQNVQHFLEIKVLLHASAGTVQLRVDGTPVLTLVSQITTPGAVTWDEWRFGRISGTTSPGNPQEVNFDDFYLLDGSGPVCNDFLGDVRVDGTFPNAAGTTSGWTRSVGSDQWATIDEAAMNSDTDYNSTATLNAIDTLNFPTAPVVGATIHAIQVVMVAKKFDTGAAGITAVTRLGGVNYLGTERSLITSYSGRRQIWEVKPSDSLPWLDTDYNAAEFGYKKST